MIEIQNSGLFEHSLCVTAQHRDMLDQVLNLFSFVPDFDLNLMRPNQNLESITSSVLMGVSGVLEECKPDLTLVHGDTTTSFAAALASFYKDIPVGHVEAGLRTGIPTSPFPEEMNRVLVARIANYHFAPTARNVQNLLREGIDSKYIIQTGNTGIDALLWASEQLKEAPPAISHWGLDQVMKQHKTLLVTGHRRENFGKGLEEICFALLELCHRHPEIHIVYPVHKNPNVTKVVFKLLSEEQRIHLIDPLPYLEFVYLIKHAYLILTDSGGIQEEAPSLGKPVLVLRENTERPEAVESNTVRLVGTDRERIVKGVEELMQDTAAYQRMSKAENPYGDGHASKRIVEALRLQFHL